MYSSCALQLLSTIACQLGVDLLPSAFVDMSASCNVVKMCSCIFTLLAMSEWCTRSEQ